MYNNLRAHNDVYLPKINTIDCDIDKNKSKCFIIKNTILQSKSIKYAFEYKKKTNEIEKKNL